jgi:hypothetical protein
MAPGSPGSSGRSLVAIDSGRVQPPLLAWFPLPFGPQPIYVGVQEEHERILKRRVAVKDVAAGTEIDVSGVMGVLDRLPDCLPLLGLRQTVAGRQDGGVRVQRGRSRTDIPADLSRRVRRVSGVVAATGEATAVVQPIQRWPGSAAGAAHEPIWAGAEQVDHPPGTVRALARVGLPVPVVQRDRGVDLPEERLVAVDQLTVPGNECRSAVHMGGLVDLVLLVPERHAVGVAPLVQLQDGVPQLVPFGLGHLGDVPPDDGANRRRGGERKPGVGADDPVDQQAVGLLELAHRERGLGPEAAVDGQRGSPGIQLPLHRLDRVASTA